MGRLRVDVALLERLEDSLDGCMRLIGGPVEYESFPTEKAKKEMETFMVTVKLIEQQLVHLQTTCASVEAVAVAAEVEDLKEEVERKNQLIEQSRSTLVEWNDKYVDILARSQVYAEFQAPESLSDEGL